MLNWLIDPKLKQLELGTPARFHAQREIIKSRPILRNYYDNWYRLLTADERTVPPDRQGIILELGSGSSYLKEFCPEVVTSDVTEGVADLVIDAQKLPFADSTVRAILMTHSFHHIPDVGRFLSEANRVLVPGGVISMVEVAHTPFARFFFERFHDEPYDDQAKDWAFPAGHSMADSNQSLSWNVFFRDSDIFSKQFPMLSLEAQTLLPWCGYLLSGGVNYRNIIPRGMTSLFKALDSGLSFMNAVMALHWHLRIRKQAVISQAH